MSIGEDTASVLQVLQGSPEGQCEGVSRGPWRERPSATGSQKDLKMIRVPAGSRGVHRGSFSCSAQASEPELQKPAGDQMPL